jgi:hypothetical protein
VYITQLDWARKRELRGEVILASRDESCSDRFFCTNWSLFEYDSVGKPQTEIEQQKRGGDRICIVAVVTRFGVITAYEGEGNADGRTKLGTHPVKDHKFVNRSFERQDTAKALTATSKTPESLMVILNWSQKKLKMLICLWSKKI